MCHYGSFIKKTLFAILNTQSRGVFLFVCFIFLLWFQVNNERRNLASRVDQKEKQNDCLSGRHLSEERATEVAAWEPISSKWEGVTGPEQAWEMDVTQEPPIKTISNW